MKALILQHSPDDPPGTLTQWLQQNNIAYDIQLTPQIQTWPSVVDHDMLFVLGGEMNVDQEAIYPWLTQEKRFISQFIKTGKKTFGICLGGQLLAEILGAHVGKHKHWEVGWHDIQVQGLDESLNGTRKVFQWHGYSFETPKQATRICSSEGCVNQGFVYQNILGLQFHPESTKDWILGAAEDANRAPQGPYTQNQQQILEQMQSLPQMQSWFFRLLDVFIKSHCL